MKFSKIPNFWVGHPKELLSTEQHQLPCNNYLSKLKYILRKHLSILSDVHSFAYLWYLTKRDKSAYHFKRSSNSRYLSRKLANLYFPSTISESKWESIKRSFE